MKRLTGVVGFEARLLSGRSRMWINFKIGCEGGASPVGLGLGVAIIKSERRVKTSRRARVERRSEK